MMTSLLLEVVPLGNVVHTAYLEVSYSRGVWGVSLFFHRYFYQTPNFIKILPSKVKQNMEPV